MSAALAGVVKAMRVRPVPAAVMASSRRWGWKAMAVGSPSSSQSIVSVPSASSPLPAVSSIWPPVMARWTGVSRAATTASRLMASARSPASTVAVAEKPAGIIPVMSG